MGLYSESFFSFQKWPESHFYFKLLFFKHLVASPSCTFAEWGPMFFLILYEGDKNVWGNEWRTEGGKETTRVGEGSELGFGLLAWNGWLP